MTNDLPYKITRYITTYCTIINERFPICEFNNIISELHEDFLNDPGFVSEDIKVEQNIDYTENELLSVTYTTSQDDKIEAIWIREYYIFDNKSFVTRETYELSSINVYKGIKNRFESEKEEIESIITNIGDKKYKSTMSYDS